jgi:dTMP kinase
MAERSKHRGLFLVLEGADGAGTTTQADRLTLRLRARGETVVRVDQPARQAEMMTAPGALLRSMLAKEQPMLTDALATQMLFIADRLEQHTRVINPALQRGEVVVSDRGELSTLVYGVATSPLYRCFRSSCGWAADKHPDRFVAPPETATARRALEEAAAYCLWHGDRFDAERTVERLLEAVLHRSGGATSRCRHEAEAFFAVPLYASALMAPHFLVPSPNLTIVLQVGESETARRRAARGGAADAFDGTALQERVTAAYGAVRWLVRAGAPGRYGQDTLHLLDADGTAEQVQEDVWARVEPLLKDGPA